MSAVGIVSPLRSHPVKLFHPEHEVDAVVFHEGVAAVVACLVLSGGSGNYHHTVHGVAYIHAVDVHLHEVVVSVQSLSAGDGGQCEVGLSGRGIEFLAHLREGDDVDGLVGALVQGDGLVGPAILMEGDGGVVNRVRHQAVVDLGSHAVLHVVAVLDGIRNQMVLYDGVDAVVDV